MSEEIKISWGGALGKKDVKKGSLGRHNDKNLVEKRCLRETEKKKR